jgi:hypothetical protein
MSSKNNRGRNLPEGWTSNISKKSRPGQRYYTNKNGRTQWSSPLNNMQKNAGGDVSIDMQDSFKARDAAAQLYYIAEAKAKAAQQEDSDAYRRIVWGNSSEEMKKLKQQSTELSERKKEADIELKAAQERFKNASQEADKKGKYPPYAGSVKCAAYVVAAAEEAAQKAVRKLQDEDAKHPPCVGSGCAAYREQKAVKQAVEAHRAHEEAAQKAARECEEAAQKPANEANKKGKYPPYAGCAAYAAAAGEEAAQKAGRECQEATQKTEEPSSPLKLATIPPKQDAHWTRVITPNPIRGGTKRKIKKSRQTRNRQTRSRQTRNRR